MIAYEANLAVMQAEPVAVSDYQKGVAARRAGQPDRAVEYLQRASVLEPSNADVWVQYGFALRDAGQFAKARTAFLEALNLAPDYDDARNGLKSLSGASDLRAVQLNLDGSLTRVRGDDDWREFIGNVSVPISGQTSVRGRLEQAHRFGRTDTFASSRLDFHLDQESTIYLAAGGTVHADFKPIWQLSFGGDRKIRAGNAATLVTLDGALSRYRTGRNLTLSPGLQQYFGNGSAWVTAKWINVIADNRHEAGVLGRIDWAPTGQFRLFAGAADAPDLEAGQVRRTMSLFGGTSVTISRRVDWRISAARDKPSGRSTRTTISTGLTMRIP